MNWVRFIDWKYSYGWAFTHWWPPHPGLVRKVDATNEHVLWKGPYPVDHTSHTL